MGSRGATSGKAGGASGLSGQAIADEFDSGALGLIMFQAKQFDDKARSRGMFDGDGDEESEWFTQFTNSEELLQMIMRDPNTAAAFRAWSQGYMMGADIYTKPFSKLRKREQAWRREMDSILDESTASQGFTVKRLSTAELLFGAGKTTATLEECQAMKGQSIFSKGNMSASAASEGLQIKGSPKRHEYQIAVERGKKGAGTYIGDKRINPKYGDKQREFVTNRDAWYTVGDSWYDKKRRVIVTELIFDGVDRHNYD